MTACASNRAANDAANELALRLHSLAIHLLRLLRRDDAALGISAARLSALSVVGFGGPRTLGELAAAEQVTPPTMTRLVAALERDGLVSRDLDRVDRRVVHVAATQKGRDLLQRGQRQRTERLAAHLRALGVDDRLTLEHAAALLERFMDEAR